MPCAKSLPRSQANVWPPCQSRSWPVTGSRALDYLQRTSLKDALEAARRATEISPAFGFAWARVAELEFSFGHHRESAKALERALALSPKNAEALALRGFVLSAQNKIGAALESFQQAIEADGALGNGWLGRGLCRIRCGDFSEGRRDLQTAAALEPNRSFLRSYLGKAFSQEYDTLHARRELSLARRLDENDPTPWLYQSWLDYQQNQPNAAVEDLETSQALNDNRAVYRSRFLLDQDRAVGSSSLARIYQDAGLKQVSVNEATRAVTYDYADYSAHLFLADSLYALRIRACSICVTRPRGSTNCFWPMHWRPQAHGPFRRTYRKRNTQGCSNGTAWDWIRSANIEAMVNFGRLLRNMGPLAERVIHLIWIIRTTKASGPTTISAD